MVPFSLSSTLFSSIFTADNGTGAPVLQHVELLQLQKPEKPTHLLRGKRKTRNIKDLFNKSCDSQSQRRAGQWEGLWEGPDVWPGCDSQNQSGVSGPAPTSNLISNSHVGMLVHLRRSGAADEVAEE